MEKIYVHFLNYKIPFRNPLWKYLFAAVVSLLAFLKADAQNDPLYAQYLNNPLVINPAYTGLNNNFNTSITYRKQWAGFDGSPTTVNFSAHTSVYENKMGLGLLVIQDKIGNTKNTEVQGTYSYKLDLGEKTYLSFGLQAGFINFRTDNSELNPYDRGDVVFAQNQNLTKPSFGAGIILKSERYFLGLSVPRLLKATGTFTDSASNQFEASLYNQHFYAMAAYVFYLSDHVRFKPSALLKGLKGAPLSLDFNASFVFDEKLIAGLYTRNLNSYGILMQLKFNNGYRFGYTFEMPTNKSVGTQFSTHEICLGLNLAMFKSHDSSISNF